MFEFKSLDGKEIVADSATGELSKDGKTLTVTAASGVFEGRYQVKIKAIATKEGTDKTAAYDKVLDFGKDTTAPTAKAERVSASSYKIVFSEPVKEGTVTAKYADGTDVTGITFSPASIGSTGIEEIAVTLGEDVELDKEIVVTLNGVQDMAGNLISPQPSTVTMVKKAGDKVAPKLTSVTQTGDLTFNIVFDKEVKEAVLTGGDVKDNIKVTNPADNEVTAIKKISAKEYEVTVTNPLYGVTKVEVQDGKAENMDGVAETGKLSKTVTFVKDEVAPVPTAKLVKNKAGEEVIELTFDKDVSTGKVVINGTTKKDYISKDLVEIDDLETVRPDAKNKKVLHVPLEGTLATEGAVYTLEIASTEVTSDSGIAMKDVKYTFTRGKNDTPVVTNGEFFETGDITIETVTNTPDKVEVKFIVDKTKVHDADGSLRLDGATATDANNYSIAGAVITAADLQKAKTADGKTVQSVILTIEENSNIFSGPRNATVKNVKIANSTKVMSPISLQAKLTENVRPTVKGAELKDNKTIVVTFSEAMSAATLTNALVVKAGDEEIAITSAAIVEGEKTATITLTQPLSQKELAKAITVELATKDGKVVASELEKIKDSNHNVIKEFSPITVARP